MKPRRRLLGAEDVERGLRELAEITAGDAAPVVMIGTVALYYYGSERLADSLDVVAQRPLPGALPDRGPLRGGGRATGTASGVLVNWITRDDDFAAVFAAAPDFTRRLDGVAFQVASPEYLVVTTMIAGRDIDKLDLLTLLRSGAVDVPVARSLVKHLLGAYAAAQFDARVAEGAWRVPVA